MISLGSGCLQLCSTLSGTRILAQELVKAAGGLRVLAEADFLAVTSCVGEVVQKVRDRCAADVRGCA